MNTGLDQLGDDLYIPPSVEVGAEDKFSRRLARPVRR